MGTQMTLQEQVEGANLSFYQAMQNLSIDMMDSVWLQADWVQCIHPNWETITGWEEIRRELGKYLPEHTSNAHPTQRDLDPYR